MTGKYQIARPRLEKDFEQFVRLLPQLEPIEFFGLAKLFGVALCELDETDGTRLDRPLDRIFEDMMNRFEGLKKKKRKEILEIMSQAASKRGQ